ncbi:Phage tail tube protein [Pluralibacter gergoviae]|nr:Phage tail tube protein [Pluralibacter gergoviae]
MSILGMASIRINGREIKTEGKSTLNPGGYARHAAHGGRQGVGQTRARWPVPRSR